MRMYLSNGSVDVDDLDDLLAWTGDQQHLAVLRGLDARGRLRVGSGIREYVADAALVRDALDAWANGQERVDPVGVRRMEAHITYLWPVGKGVPPLVLEESEIRGLHVVLTTAHHLDAPRRAMQEALRTRSDAGAESLLAQIYRLRRSSGA